MPRIFHRSWIASFLTVSLQRQCLHLLAARAPNLTLLLAWYFREAYPTLIPWEVDQPLGAAA
jgi:hypothetical protein